METDLDAQRAIFGDTVDKVFSDENTDYEVMDGSDESLTDFMANNRPDSFEPIVSRPEESDVHRSFLDEVLDHIASATGWY